MNICDTGRISFERVYQRQFISVVLRKIPKFYLISWYRNFVETHFPQNFSTRRLGEIPVFYAVLNKILRVTKKPLNDKN